MIDNAARSKISSVTSVMKSAVFFRFRDALPALPGNRKPGEPGNVNTYMIRLNVTREKKTSEPTYIGFKWRAVRYFDAVLLEISNTLHR